MSTRYLAAVSRSSSRIRLASTSNSARNTPFHSALNSPVHSTFVSQESLGEPYISPMEPKPQTSRMDMRSSSEVGLGPLGRPAPSEYSESNSNLSSSDSTPSSDPGMDISSVTGASSPAGEGNDNSSQYSNVCVYRMPIVGYEVLEERSRFTVFKIQIVHQVTGEQWFVFRRYTDFVRLNKKLKLAFPGLRFSLPPKKWFGDNFDPLFLEDRQIGLQAFIDNIIGHTKIRECQAVRKFFCLDYPPGPHDSLEESRAMCQSLEDSIAELQEHLKEKDGEISILKSHIHFLSAQQRTLVKALRLECEINEEGKHPPGSTHDLNCALLSICEKSLNGTFGDMGSIASLERELTCDGRRARSSSDNQITSPVRKILERVFLPSSSQTTYGNTTSTGVSSMSTIAQSESDTNNALQQGSVTTLTPKGNTSVTTMAQKGVAGFSKNANSSSQEESSKTLQSAQRNGLVRHKVCDGGQYQMGDKNCMISSGSNSNITNNNTTTSNGFLQVPTASR